MATIKWNNWRDNLKDASFKKVSFKVLNSKMEGGRRNVLHQYPFSEEPYLEDMGKDAGTYFINAYVVQNTENNFDYFKERDALKTALESEGAGQLIHPFYGKLNVGVLGKFQIEESFTEGGIARFTVTFVDAGKQKQPSGNYGNINLDDSCTDAIEKTKSNFEKFYDTVTGAAYLAAEAYNIMNDFVSEIYTTLNTVQSIIVSSISMAQTTIATINQTISDVINFPDQLAEAIGNMFTIYEDLIPNMPENNTSLAHAALSLTLFGEDFPDISVTTPDRQQQLDNQNALIDITRCMGLIQGIRIAVYIDYQSYEDAMAMLNALLTAFDNVLDNIGANSKNDELFNIVNELKPSIINIMLAKGANLPIMRSIELPPDTQPSILLAYNIYNDKDRELEIINRNYNTILHPGFPKGGEIIKVLSE